MVPVIAKLAALAGESSDGNRHLLPVSTIVASLRSVSGVHSHNSSTSFYRFVEQKSEEQRPSYVVNTFREFPDLSHSVDLKILNGDETKIVDDSSRSLMSKVLSAKANSFINSRDWFSKLFPLRSSFLHFFKLFLGFGKFFFVRFKKPLPLNLFSVREGGKAIQSYVNAYLFFALWKGFRYGQIASEIGVPFAGGGSADSTSFEITSQLSMQIYFNISNIVKLKNTPFEITTPWSLWERHAVVAAKLFESGIPRLLPRFGSSEERFECKIDTKTDILETLCKNCF